MKKNLSLISVLLCLILMFSLLSVTAFAEDKAEKPQESPAPTAEAEDKAAEEDKKEADKAVEKASETEDSEEPETVIVEEGTSHYAKPGTIVFNNGGTVYNNDAVVYNNGGVVYNNLGLVYNNGGTVYANGGTVYNNSGEVYNNDAEVISHDKKDEATEEAPEEAAPEEKPQPEESASEEKPLTEEAADEKAEDEAKSEDTKSAKDDVPEAEVKEGFYQVVLAEDYSEYVEFKDLDEAGQLYVAKKEDFSFELKPGYELASYTLSSGDFKDNEDGSYTISNINEDAELEPEFALAAPAMSLESGTYFHEQELEISSAEGAKIYYTTDGSKPTEKSSKYKKPLKLEEGAVIKALAVSEELGESEISSVEIAVAEVEIPEFKDAKKDYGDIEPEEIEIENKGQVDAVIKKLSLSGEHSKYFKLSESAEETIPAGESEKGHWTVNPLSNLDKGEYSVTVTAESGSGQTADFELSFKVK